MMSLDDVAALQIGDGSGELQDTMEGTTCEMKLLHGGAKQALCRRFHYAEILDLFGRHIGIAR